MQIKKANVFVPFLGDFLSIGRGIRTGTRGNVFVPFLGDFLSMML